MSTDTPVSQNTPVFKSVTDDEVISSKSVNDLDIANATNTRLLLQRYNFSTDTTDANTIKLLQEAGVKPEDRYSDYYSKLNVYLQPSLATEASRQLRQPQQPRFQQQQQQQQKPPPVQDTTVTTGKADDTRLIGRNLDDQATQIPQTIYESDPITGKSYSVRTHLGQDESDVNALTKSRDAQAVYHGVTGAMTPSEREDFENMEPEGWLEYLGKKAVGGLDWALSPLMVPQSGLHKAVYEGSKLMLPVGGEEFFATVVYPTMRGTSEVFTPGMGVTADLMDADPYNFGMTEEQIKAGQEEFKQLETEIGRKVYQRIVSGELEKQYSSTYEGTLAGAVVDMKRYRGVETLNGLITTEEAARLAEVAKKANNVSAYETYTALSEPFAREVYGAALEVIGDPLWFVGLPKGAQTAELAGETYTLTGKAVDATESLARSGKMSQRDANLIVTKALVEQDEASKLAIVQAKKVANEKKTLALQEVKKIDEVVESDVLASGARYTDEKKADVIAVASERVAQQQKASAAYIASQNKTNAISPKQVMQNEKAFEAASQSVKNIDGAVEYLDNQRQFLVSDYHTAKMDETNLDDLLETLLYNSKPDDADTLLAGVKPRPVGVPTPTKTGTFNVHIPFTQYYGRLLPKFKLKLTPVKGADTVDSFTARVGMTVDELATLNKIDPGEVARRITNGEDLAVSTTGNVFALGKRAIAKAVTQKTNPLSPADIKQLNSRLTNGETFRDFTLAERFAYALSLGDPTKYLLNVPMRALDWLAQAFTSRWYQPFLAKLEAEQAMAYFRIRGADTNKLADMMGTAKATLFRLERTAPQIWEQYMKAYGQYADALNVAFGSNMQSIGRITELAEQIATARKQGNPELQNLTGGDVLQEAASIREQGRAFPEDLKGLSDKLNELVSNVAKETPKEEEKVRQALQNIARFGHGDPAVAKQLDKEIRQITEVIAKSEADVTKKVTKEIGKISKQRTDLKVEQSTLASKQSTLASKQAQSKITSAKNQAQIDELNKQIESLQAKKNKRPSPEKIVSDYKASLVTLRQSLDVLSEQSKRIDGLIAQSNKNPDVKNYRKMIADMGDPKKLSPEDKVTYDKIKSVLDQIDDEVKALKETKKAITAEKTKLTREIKKDPKKLEAEARKQQAKDDKLLDDLLAKRKTLEGKDYRNATQLKKQITELNEQESKIRATLKAYNEAYAKSETVSLPASQITKALQKSLDDIIGKRTELLNLQQDLEKVKPQLLVNRFKSGEDVDYIRSLKEWEINLWTGYDNLVKDILKQEDGYERVLQAVLHTFRRNEQITPDVYRQMHRNLTGTDVVGEVPKPPKGLTETERQSLVNLKRANQNYERRRRSLQAKIDNGEVLNSNETKSLTSIENEIQKNIDKIAKLEDKDRLSDLYPTVIGQRYMDVPADIEPLVDELDILLDSYKLLFQSHGYEFIKSPSDIVRHFGVADYVPHLRSPRSGLSSTAKREKALSEHEAAIVGSANLDAKKFRSLMGTMDEINSLMRSGKEDWIFNMNPELLFGRLYSLSRGVEGHVLYLNLLKSGVIRKFDTAEEAAMAGYLPLLEQQYKTLDRDVILLGSQGRLIDATGELIKPEEFNGFIKELLESPKGPQISWAQEIKEIANVKEVEQTVGVVRAIQGRIKAGEMNNIFKTDFEVLDVPVMHERLADDAHKALMERLRTERDTLSRKITEKGTPESEKGIINLQKEKDRLAKLDERLNPESNVHLLEKERVSRKQWPKVAEEINRQATVIKNHYRTPPSQDPLNAIMKKQAQEGGLLPPVTPRSLQIYFNKNQPIIRMYVPGTVSESLRSLGTPAWEAFTKSNYGKMMTRLNNYFKLRMTVQFTPFHMRNAVGNTISNIYDVGAGALSPLHNMRAVQIAGLVDYHSYYGSLEKAAQALKTAPKGETTVAKIQRNAKRAELALLKDKKIDLGDGILRTYDDALDIMVNRNVISGSGDFRLEIDSTQSMLFDMADRLSMAQKGQKNISKTFKFLDTAIHDVVMPGTSLVVSGVPGLVVPTGWGKVMARRFENQARATNFLANMAKGKTIEESAQQVQKFLFNYSDLTRFQADVLRTYIPFFTWEFKNIALHLKMLLERPIYFANFRRMMYEVFPTLEGINTNESGTARMEVERQKYIERTKHYPEYARYRIRVPGFLLGLPEGYDVHGLGLPIESFNYHLGTFDRMTRALDAEAPPALSTDKTAVQSMLAKTHWAVKALSIAIGKEDPFYGQDITNNKIRQAQHVAATSWAFKQMGLDPASSFINYAYGLDPVYNRFGETIYLADDEVLSTILRKYQPFGGMPLDRAMREAAVFSDLHSYSVVSDVDGIKNKAELSDTYKYFQAFLGVKVKRQPDKNYMEDKTNDDMIDIITEKATSSGQMKNERLK